MVPFLELELERIASVQLSLAGKALTLLPRLVTGGHSEWRGGVEGGPLVCRKNSVWGVCSGGKFRPSGKQRRFIALGSGLSSF